MFDKIILDKTFTINEMLGEKIAILYLRGLGSNRSCVEMWLCAIA